MKTLFVMAVVAAGVVTSLSAQAQSSTATSAQSSNSNSNATNNGTNASSNTSGATASQTAASSSNNQGNNQYAGGGSGGAGGTASAGAAGGNVSATISPTTTIQFNSPPTSRVESASVQDTTSRIEQSGTTEQILSGTRTERIEYSGTTTVRNVPSMNAPPLTSSNDTCMGSWSAGVAVAGFGASGGHTYTDEHCKRIKMSRELWNKGMKAASLALDCMDRDAREALELTGFVCPQTTRAQQRAEAAQPISTVSYAPVVTPVVASVSSGAAAVTTSAPAPAVAAPISAVVVTEGATADQVRQRLARPGYEHVNPNDPFINR